MSPEFIERTMAALVSEADLDGLCTATLERLGEVSGFHYTGISRAIDTLAEQGRVKIVSRKRGMKEWRLGHDSNEPIYNVGEYQLLGEEWS